MCKYCECHAIIPFTIFRAAYEPIGMAYHNGAKWAQIEKWPCISGVHFKIFMKFGHH